MDKPHPRDRSGETTADVNASPPDLRDPYADPLPEITNCRPSECRDESADDPGDGAQHYLSGVVVDLIDSGLESALWRTAEAWSATAHPIAGPLVVRSVYLSGQLYRALRGLNDGGGFEFKISIPGLGTIPGSPIPDGWELVARAKLAGRARPISECAVTSEIQIFEPWVSNVDVGPSGAGSAMESVPTESDPPPDGDPWAAWLSLLGVELVQNLGKVLADATRQPAPVIQAALLTQWSSGRARVPQYHRRSP